MYADTAIQKTVWKFFRKLQIELPYDPIAINRDFITWKFNVVKPVK